MGGHMAFSVRGGPCSLCHSPWRLGGNVEAVVSSAGDGLARGVEVVCAEFGALAQAGAGLCPACRRGPTTGDGNHDKREVTPRPRGKTAMRGLPRGAQQVADVIPGGAAQPQGSDPEAQHLDGPPGGRPVLDGGLQRGQIRLPSAENDAELASQQGLTGGWSTGLAARLSLHRSGGCIWMAGIRSVLDESREGCRTPMIQPGVVRSRGRQLGRSFPARHRTARPGTGCAH